MKSKEQKYQEAVQRNIEMLISRIRNPNCEDEKYKASYGTERLHALQDLRNRLSIRENDIQFDDIIKKEFINVK